MTSRQEATVYLIHPPFLPQAGAVRSANGNANFTTSAIGVDMKSARVSGIAAALALARDADHVILCLGINKSIEHEGVDRTELAGGVPIR